MKVTSRSPEETEEIGFKLGRHLKKGSVVGLYGELGTGKTTMVKGIAKAFGIGRRDITSASFTIVAEYPGNPSFYHIDLYRLGDDGDIEGTGIWDYMGKDSIAVVEWAEKMGEPDIKGFVKVRIRDLGGDQRELVIEGMDEEDRDYL